MPRTPVQGMAFVIGLWVIVSLLMPLAARGAPPADLAALEDALHGAVNAFRVEHHRILLERRPELDAVARAHSEDMAARGFLAHETPEGRNPVDRLQRGGVTGFSLAGENAGQTSRSAPNTEILEGWKHSPVHRTNLLAYPWNATGIGIARAADGTLYYTQLYVTFPR